MGGSVTNVPLCLSLETWKFPATYWPSNVMVAVWVPLVTASVPRFVKFWVQVALVTPEVNPISRKSSLSGLPNPATRPLKVSELSNKTVPPPLVANVTVAALFSEPLVGLVEPPLLMSSIPPLMTAPLATPPESTVSKLPLSTSAALSKPPDDTISRAPLRSVVPLALPNRAKLESG